MVKRKKIIKTSQKNKIYHLIILDKSGSMSFVTDTTIEGINEQIQSIRVSAGNSKKIEQRVCIVQFANNIDHTSLWNKNINDIEDYNNQTYVADGPSTSLNDAIGISINKLKNEIADELKEKKANIVTTIFTDGYENSSQEYNGEQVADMIKALKEDGQWNISFMGCGSQEEVLRTASKYNIAKGNIMGYGSGQAGTQMAFASMATSRSLYTTAISAAIDNDEDTSEINQADNFFQKFDLNKIEDIVKDEEK